MRAADILLPFFDQRFLTKYLTIFFWHLWLNQCLLSSLLLMICIPCTQACRCCQRSDISVEHLTCTVKYTSNGPFWWPSPGIWKSWVGPPHHSITLGPKQMRRGLDYFGILGEKSWWWLFAAQLQDFIHCIERQQSVPVLACMSHCSGMLAPGTQQLTALTSVNKLIAGDWRTTQPLC